MGNPYFDDQMDSGERRRHQRREQHRRFSRKSQSFQKRLTTFLWGYVCAPLRWIWSYVSSRDLVRIARGIPSVAMGVVFAFVLYEARRVSSGDLTKRYQEAAQVAIDQEDDVASLLWLREAVNLDPKNRRLRYSLAVELDRQGQTQRAFDLMNRLAPLDKAGLPEAHAWIASELLERQKERISPEELKYIRYHVEQVLQLDETNELANLVMGQIEMREGNLLRAIAHYSRLPTDNATAQLTLAQLYRVAGRQSDAEDAADHARDAFEETSRTDRNNLVARMGWARAEAFLTNYAQAATLLNRAIDELPRITLEMAKVVERAAKAEDSELPSSFDIEKQQGAHLAILRRQLARVYLAWRSSMVDDDPRDQEKEMELLLKAVEAAPEDELVIAELAKMAAADDPDPVVEKLMSEMLTAGKATALAHFILGTTAVQKDDMASAERHLRLAVQGNPRLAAASNNLAWLLMSADPPRLEEAESLVDLAAQHAPSHPEIRETRGQIRARMGKTDLAIADLEYALGKLGSRPSIHEALASLYSELGDTVLADQHRALAAQAAEREKGIRSSIRFQR